MINNVSIKSNDLVYKDSLSDLSSSTIIVVSMLMGAGIGLGIGIGYGLRMGAITGAGCAATFAIFGIFLNGYKPSVEKPVIEGESKTERKIEGDSETKREISVDDTKRERKLEEEPLSLSEEQRKILDEMVVIRDIYGKAAIQGSPQDLKLWKEAANKLQIRLWKEPRLIFQSIQDVNAVKMSSQYEMTQIFRELGITYRDIVNSVDRYIFEP